MMVISTAFAVTSFVLGGAYLLGGIPAVQMAVNPFLPKRSTAEILEEVFANCKLKAGDKLPGLIKRQPIPSGLRMIYSIPYGLSISDFLNNQDAIETATKSSAKIWLSQKGYLCMDLKMKVIQDKIEFEFEGVPKDMILGIPVGFGRGGLTWLDLTEAPHLLIAGETFGGKSNCLHQMLVTLLKNVINVRLCIIDLKVLEFAAYEKHAWYEYSLEGSIRMLNWLTKEMHRRLKILKDYGVVKIQDYEEENLPYIVLAADEMSQLNPDGEPDPDTKKVKQEAQRMLYDLAGLARCVGIHLVLATQRPDAKVIPGGLKANIPAKICYPVTSRVNSQIVLDNDAAFYLTEKKGRCVFKFRGQEELQTMHLDIKARLKKILKGIPAVNVKLDLCGPEIKKGVESTPI